MSVERVVVLGIGNRLMKDEGIGPRGVDALAERSLPPGVELVDGGTSPFDALAGRGGGKLIVIDAAAAGGEPGTMYLHRGKQGDLAAAPPSMSLHDRGLPEALAELALAGDTWREVVFIGVEPDEIVLGEELSRPVREVIDKVVSAVLKEAIPGRLT